MRPDLFAGPALRDDRHRILARLANGGSVPAPARQWLRWEPPQRARLAAVATLLATGAAAWVWLQNGAPARDRLQEPAMRAAPQAVPPSSAAMPGTAPQQAAIIVNAALAQSEPAAASAAAAAAPTPSSTTGAGLGLKAAKPADSKPPYRHSAKVASTPRRQQSAATAPESDEDVTLLAAMLKHAKPQKPSPTQPKD
ncbi:MAG TPA: hypothetical protein VGD52_20740 [Pseudoduganella sp.]